MTKFKFNDQNKVVYWTVKETWDEVTEPPITMRFTDEELGRFIEEPLRTQYSCHTQAVERGVATTSQATSQISGHIRQIGEVLAIIAAREYIPGRVTRINFNYDYESLVFD